MSKASISFRIGLWFYEERFKALLELLANKYSGLSSEISFFASNTHAPMGLDTYSRTCEILEQRMRYAQSYGFRAGINLLTTIGHHEENLPNSLDVALPRMTDIQGNICRGSYCPNNEAMRSYVRAIYLKTVETNPDFIWIDDDVRLLGHLPIRETCFCDNCLEVFAVEFGDEHTRQSLNSQFNSENVSVRLKYRKNWLEHNRSTIAALLELIENTVHAKDVTMPIGFMSGERFYEGYAFGDWANILSGKSKSPVWWRPGGGFYSDDKLTELVQKSHEIGRQVSLLPEHVSIIQSEIENFPYQPFRKASHVTAVEAACHIAAGCTGAAFNVLAFDEPMDEFEPWRI